VVIVEDDPVLSGFMAEWLESASHEVRRVGRVDEAIDLLRRLHRHTDVILLDYGLADGTAEPIVHAVLDLRVDAALVFMTGLNSASMLGVSAGLRADFRLDKPFGREALLETVDRALQCVWRRRGELPNVPDEWLDHRAYARRRANAIARLAEAPPAVRELVRLRLEGRPWHEIAKFVAMSRAQAQRKERELMERLGLRDLQDDVDRVLAEACARGQLREPDFLDPPEPYPGTPRPRAG
jgi:DNA-binding response OmpR family regulator